jgi:hypothetical protein
VTPSQTPEIIVSLELISLFFPAASVAATRQHRTENTITMKLFAKEVIDTGVLPFLYKLLKI